MREFSRAALGGIVASVFLAAPLSSWAQASTSDILQELRFRNVGPAVMSGRIADLEVDPKRPATIYVATASGGVWKSTSGGVNWTPIFDSMDSASIGDVTVSSADSNIIWVGAGESNNRNSSAWGRGVYKSADAGATWTKMGLESTQQIARIVTHPKDPNIVWVAALGALWGPNEDRGVYRTEDGGKTWTKVLYTDENTGAIDLVIDPKNANVLYAAMYERRRYPYTFRSGGPNGGIFKSTDGGKKWEKLGGGLPTGQTGRIGLTIYPQNPKIVYAIIEAERGEKPEDNKNGVYRSDDAGKTWKKGGTFNTRPFYYHEILVDPNDDKHLLGVSTSLMESKDAGATWRSVRISVHVDFHALWINPNNSEHWMTGSDGGVAVTYDGGASWRHMANICVAQFYAVCYDMAYPYHVYGGLQDNGSWGGPSRSRSNRGIGNYEWYNVGGGDGFHVQVNWEDNVTVYSESQGGNIQRYNKKTGQSSFIRGSLPRPAEGQRFRFNWSSPIVMSPHNPKVVWFAGNVLFKTVDGGDSWKAVSPDLTTNDPEKQKPMGGLSPENTGAETHCTIITVAESPLRPDTVWVGTDDGMVQLTENGGVEWKNVTANIQDLPKGTWCSRVTASKFKLERAYATFDGHRSNDMNAYVYVTEDFGQTWKSLRGNLPAESVYVIKEDLANENVLYVGTEFGLYVSLDRGTTWTAWKSGLPPVAVHDIVLHPREREIILGTHGRGIWIAPADPLQELTGEVQLKNAHLFDPVTAVQWVRDPTGGYGDGEGWFFGQNPPPGARLAYYLGKAAEEVKVEILSADGAVIYTFATAPGTAGTHVLYWPFRVDAPGGGQPGGAGGGGGRGGGGGGQRAGRLVDPGTYGVRLTVKGEEPVTKKLVVIADPISK